MPTTVTIADELADRLKPYASDLPAILELGIREWTASHEPGYGGLGDVLEALAGLPDPQQVLALRPAPALQERIEALLEKSRESAFSDSERREWDSYRYMEHLVRLAKTNAVRKLGAGAS